MIKKLLFIVVLLAMVMPALLPQVAMAQTTVDDSTDTTNFLLSCQRTSFVAHDMRWLLYEEGGTIRYRYSTDLTGVSWSAMQSLSETVAYGQDFAIYFSAPFLYLTTNIGTNVYFRRYTPNANGSMTASAVLQTVSTSAKNGDAKPNVGVDGSDCPWISYTGNDNSPYFSKSSTDDGTWSTAIGFPYRATTNTEASGWYTAIIPLTGNKMLAVYAGANTYKKLYVKYYNAGFGSEKQNTSTINSSSWSVVAQDDDAHFAFGASGTHDVMYVKYSLGTDTFGSEVQIYNSAIAYQATIISRITDTNDLNIFWANAPSADHLYFARYTATESTWYSYYDLVTELSGLPNNDYYLNTDYTISTSDELGVYYATGETGALLRFKYLGEQFDVDTLTPTGVTETQATLRGEIVSIGWGSPLERGFYLNTSESFVGAAKYSESGSFSVGVFSRTVGGLSPSVTYHYCAYATNAETIYGNWTSFGTLAEGEYPEESGNCTVAPAIEIKDATYISVTSARLNSYISNAGCSDCTCSVYFQWYKTGGAWGDNQNFLVSGYSTGNRPYLNIYSLEGNTTYHFRAVATNSCGTTYSDSESFTTLVSLDSVAMFVAIPRVNEPSIDLSWAKPSGATEVMVRYKIGSYPGNITDGTLVCTSSMNAFAHEDLTAGDTLWYSAWGISGNSISTTAAYAIATVSLAIPGDSGIAPGAPTDWFRDVCYTNLENMPGYDIINWVADGFGFSREFFWMMLGLLIGAFGFIVAYVVTKGNYLVAGLVTLVVLGVETPMGLMAGFIVFIWVIPTIMFGIMKARA